MNNFYFVTKKLFTYLLTYIFFFIEFTGATLVKKIIQVLGLHVKKYLKDTYLRGKTESN